MIACMLLCALCVAGPAQAEPPRWKRAGDGFAKAFDVVPVRFVTSIQLVLGALFFVPAAAISYPVTAIANGHEAGQHVVEEAWGIFVLGPYETTFLRPLGG